MMDKIKTKRDFELLSKKKAPDPLIEVFKMNIKFEENKRKIVKNTTCI